MGLGQGSDWMVLTDSEIDQLLHQSLLAPADGMAAACGTSADPWGSSSGAVGLDAGLSPRGWAAPTLETAQFGNRDAASELGRVPQPQQAEGVGHGYGVFEMYQGAHQGVYHNIGRGQFRGI